uniref:NADH-ubiquinone oxidoreductase chain 1 n=1 Tax=Polyplax spinulosa TaxID=468197 RepID=V9PXK7_9NEOP|nr:NADH dehydrogenase subunit 1 [Polyplax spinulosa]
MIFFSYLFAELILLVSFLLMVAFYTLFERKVMGLSQSRLGPSKVLLKGVGQPFSDVMKLLSKMSLSRSNEEELWYTLAPCMMMIVSVSVLGALPFYFFPSYQTSGVIIMFLLSVSAFWLTLSGWFSNSSYSTLGACRSVSQSLSFEIPLALCFISLFLISKSLSVRDWGQLELTVLLVAPWSGLILLFSFIAEAGRSPFDLPESESELVSGFNVEYGGLLFTLIFLSETLMMLVISSMFSIIFLHQCEGWRFVLSLFILTLIRPSVPRIRFDQAMTAAWLSMTPTAISAVFLSSMWS